MPTPEQCMYRAKPGTMLVVPSNRPGSNLREVTLMVRKTAAEIEAFGATGEVTTHLRGGSFNTRVNGKTVVVIPLLAAFGRPPFSDEQISEAFLDEFGNPFPGAVENLTTQDQIPVLMYGDKGRLELQFFAENIVKEYAVQAIAEIAGLEPWNAAEFDMAVGNLFSQFPTTIALWRDRGGP